MMHKHQLNFEVVPLYNKNISAPPVIKVGILPFIREDSLKTMTMKPLAEKEVLGIPQFQIAKGTRQINISGSWCDMREDDLRYADESFHEPLIATALREGSEEIGLKSKNIKVLYDMGGFTFTSASRGIKKPMHLFAAEIINQKDFGHFEATTSETRWFTREEFAREGRADHIVIMNEALKRLSEYLYK
jgi:8-oxo-dGTP pyrophosphatase MutT (NUDIX family)